MLIFAHAKTNRNQIEKHRLVINLFQLPIIVFILSVLGLLTPAFMRHYRRHAIIFVLILSAFITPPDPISLVLMSIPLMILYEFSILVSWLVNRNKL